MLILSTFIQKDNKKQKTCSFCADHIDSIDYKDAAKLKRYFFYVFLTILRKRQKITTIKQAIVKNLYDDQ